MAHAGGAPAGADWVHCPEGSSSGQTPTTAGRVIDHVGFEVRDLEAFCKKLEGKGIKLTQAYRKGSPLGANVATAMLVDPWGTVIELTEGLDKTL